MGGKDIAKDIILKSLKARKSVVTANKAVIARYGSEIYAEAAICGELDVDGLRGDIVTNRSARAIAAFEGRTEVQEEDIARVITCSLRHRLRKDPLEQVDSGERVIKAFCKVFDLNDKDNLSKFQLASQE